MSAIFNSVVEIVTRIRSRLPNEDAVEDHVLARSVLLELEKAGFADVAVSESLGGSGGTFEDLSEVIRGLASEGVFLPVAMRNVGAWVYADSGERDTSGLPVVLASVPFVRWSADRASVTFTSLPWLDLAKTLILPASSLSEYVSIDVDSLQSESHYDYNLTRSFSGKATLAEGTHRPLRASPLPEYANLYSLLLFVEAEQIVSTVYRMSVDYTQQREQFGRAIASFPAVQDLLIEVAQAAAVCNSASSRSQQAWLNFGSDTEIAKAAWLIGDSAMRAARAAHQVHGAIGMTDEYRLSKYTRRLHQLRNEIYEDWTRRGGGLSSDLSKNGFIASFIDSPV